MKKIGKGILLALVLLALAFLAGFYTDFFLPATKLTVTKGKAEIIITRLTSPEELDKIKKTLLENGIVLTVEHITVNGSSIQDLAIHLTTSHGIEGSFSTGNMRFTRYIRVIVDDNASKPISFGIGISKFLTHTKF